MPQEENFFSETSSKLKQYFQQRILLLRLQATDKVSKIASGIITAVLMVIIGIFLLIFISITLGLWFAHITHSLVLGFGIVALLYLLIFLFILLFLGKILRNLFINKLISLIHKKD